MTDTTTMADTTTALATTVNGAVEAAQEAAVALPGAPGMDEFLALAMQARMLSLSGAAPEAIRNNPHVAFHVAMVGRDLGISPTAAMAMVDVIGTSKGPQVSLSPQLLNGQVRRLGLGEIVRGEQTDTSCTAVAVGPGGRDRRCRLTWPTHVDGCECDIIGTSTFTWEDAQVAGLAGAECQPGAHKVVTRQRRNGGGTYNACGCNQGYITYPKRMLWWRAAGFVVDDWVPEASLGLYSPEALGAVVDVEGRPIDPSQVALPAGYDDPKQERQERAAQREAEREALADPDALWELQANIKALPEAQQQALLKAWVAEDSRLRGVPARYLPAGLLRAAKAMVNAYWGEAVKAGTARDGAVALVREECAGRLGHYLAGWAGWGPPGPTGTAWAPQDAPDAQGAPDTHPEAPQADTAADSPPDGATGDDAGAALEARAAKAKWMPVLRAVAEEVRAEGQDVPADVVAAIDTEVKAMHHTAVNTFIEDAHLADDYPPDSPIDLRRMVVTLGRLQQWQANNTGGG